MSESDPTVPQPDSGTPPGEWEIEALVKTTVFDKDGLCMKWAEYWNPSIFAAFRAGFHAARNSTDREVDE